MTGLIIPDLPEAEYFSRPELSASMAKVLVQPGGPAKLRWQIDNRQPAKKEFDHGHAAHTLVLGTGAPIAVIPDGLLAKNGAASTNASKEFIAQARAEGKTPLKLEDAAMVGAMAQALEQCPEAVATLRAPGARYEVSAVRTDEQTGIGLRCRFDAVAPTVIGDYKTAADAEPGKFARRSIVDLGYDLAAAHYLDMGIALGLVDPDAPFRLVVQEKKAPYLVSVITLSDAYLARGRALMRHAINLWAECTSTGVWPGYPSITAEPPAWADLDQPTELDPNTESELLQLIAEGIPA